MKMELHCIITGRVQGVMFRDFVQRKARTLDITGTVRNKQNGSVEIFALGEEKNLQRFIDFLRKGPLLTRIISHVDDITTKLQEPVKSFSDFKIIY